MNKKTKNKNANTLLEIHKKAESFSQGEEIANFVSHTVGAGLAVIAFIVLTIRASWNRDIGTQLRGTSIVVIDGFVDQGKRFLNHFKIE